MTDPTPFSDTEQTTSDVSAFIDDDPLQVNNVISEAAAIQEDVQSLEAMTHAYENDVQQFTNGFATAWDESMLAFQSEIETWQAETAKAQAAMTAEPAPPTSNANAKTPLITPEQLQALKQRLSGAATKKTPGPDA